MRVGPEQRRMSAFIGRWQGQGKNLEGAGEAAGTDVEVSSEFKWLPGEFFVEHRGVMRFGDQSLESLEVIQADGEHHYTSHQYDNMGFARKYAGIGRGNVWKLAGESEKVTIEFRDDGNTMHVHWENKKDGEWVGLCDFTQTRA